MINLWFIIIVIIIISIIFSNDSIEGFNSKYFVIKEPLLTNIHKLPLSRYKYSTPFMGDIGIWNNPTQYYPIYDIRGYPYFY